MSELLSVGRATRAISWRFRPPPNLGNCAHRATGTLPRERFSPMALSWRNLPCALKAAIGLGKRTSSHPVSLPRPRGRSKGLWRYRSSARRCTARTAGWPIAWTRPRRRSGRRGNGAFDSWLIAWIRTLSPFINKSRTERPRGRLDTTGVMAIGTFAFERTSSSAVPAG